MCHQNPNPQRRWIGSAGLVLLHVSLALAPSLASTWRSAEAGANTAATDKIAEMTAFVRHSESCPPVPPEWSIAFVAVMALATPTEEQVAAQERKVLTLRDKLGERRWCELYLLEMKEAYVIYRQMRDR